MDKIIYLSDYQALNALYDYAIDNGKAITFYSLFAEHWTIEDNLFINLHFDYSQHLKYIVVIGSDSYATTFKVKE